LAAGFLLQLSIPHAFVGDGDPYRILGDGDGVVFPYGKFPVDIAREESTGSPRALPPFRGDE